MIIAFFITKCLHNRPDGYILNDRHYVCECHHACAEVSSKPNKKDGDQTCKKLGRFYTRKPYLSCSFQNDDTQGFQNILAMYLLRPEQRNKLKNSKTCLFFSSAVKLCKKHYLWCHAREVATPKHWNKPLKL